ncbi:RICIN domain-containing protein [Micromonospora sp. D93]|uniref:RICIN domain-containing protein n=1 Tax=Micromonospora sp. D93 TaxID=2824886 RepID=UPI001B379EBB|nr:RICIN domain-containing protein [Micromonospora sp. D93]MBQ1020174.1 RICIN domain-containing protein [Micromonospora sp. D93]
MIQRSVRAIALAIAASAAVVLFNPSAALASFTNRMIINVNSGICMAVAGGSTSNNAGIVQYTCDGLDRSRWTSISSTVTGYVRIQNLNSGKCLSPAGGSPVLGVRIVQYNCDSDVSRLWKIVPSGSYYKLQNGHSLLCITVDGGSGSRNAPVVQYACDNHNARKWETW